MKKYIVLSHLSRLKTEKARHYEIKKILINIKIKSYSNLLKQLSFNQIFEYLIKWKFTLLKFLSINFAFHGLTLALSPRKYIVNLLRNCVL